MCLTRVQSLRERLDVTLSAHRNEIVALLSRFVNKRKGFMQPHELVAEFEAILKLTDRGSWMGLLEVIVLPPWVALAVRPRPGVWEYIRVNDDDECLLCIFLDLETKTALQFSFNYNWIFAIFLDFNLTNPKSRGYPDEELFLFLYADLAENKEKERNGWLEYYFQQLHIDSIKC
ncbi:hypothetical protein PRUPE_2G242300 [Prunus persica]|uniref:sucrose synthase n=1 Tax=Prunus persica TaxID=3760 RepID=A0A251QM28_PRUPE|nr:hypothetical protein PRUPE_2G242300 [Prunus persica]